MPKEIDTEIAQTEDAHKKALKDFRLAMNLDENASEAEQRSASEMLAEAGRICKEIEVKLRNLRSEKGETSWVNAVAEEVGIVDFEAESLLRRTRNLDGLISNPELDKFEMPPEIVNQLDDSRSINRTTRIFASILAREVLVGVGIKPEDVNKIPNDLIVSIWERALAAFRIEEEHDKAEIIVPNTKSWDQRISKYVH